MAHSRLEEMEGLEIQSLVPNTVVSAKSVDEHADLVRDVYKRMWLQTEPSSLSNHVFGFVVQH